MTKEQYAAITGVTRRLCSRSTLGEHMLDIPTLLCAASYLVTILILLIRKDDALLRIILVPACCFIAATILRRIIGRERPYDAFSLPPVGRYTPGKRRSLPSRHAASAAAIAFAVMWVCPVSVIRILLVLLAVLIAALRVAAGHHYPSDVLCALLLSALISFAGYRIF